MQMNPNFVLNRLKKYSTKENSKFKRLYACFYSVEFYKLAFNNLYHSSSNKTISIKYINTIIQKMRNGSYKPSNIKNQKIPTLEDKLIQEIIRLLLDAIYNDTFSIYSYGFRPNKNCHMALDDVRNRFKGSKWFIKCDIINQFNNITHECLLKILREHIYDLKFIHLINLFLKTGYLSEWKYGKTFSGVPQGTIIGPILSNIYLDKFDKYIDEISKCFNKGTRRKDSIEYHRIISRIYASKTRIKNNIQVERNKNLLYKQKNELRNYKGPIKDPFDPEYRKLRYVRYGNTFILGVIGSHQDALKIYNDIKIFFLNNLKIDLLLERFNIIHNNKKVKFLNYNIIVVRNAQKKLENGNVRLSVPYDIMINFIINNNFGKWWNNPKTGKDELKAIKIPQLCYHDDIDILKHYDMKLRMIYHYYSLSENVYKIGNFAYIVQKSFLRSLASKYKISCAKLYKNKNYCHRLCGKSQIGVTHNQIFYDLFGGPFEKKIKTVCVDKIPSDYLIYKK